MSGQGLFLIAAPLVPFLLALASIIPAVRRAAPVLLAVAPLPGLAAALLLPRGLLVLVAPEPFRLTLALDGPGALLLGCAALLWILAGAYATFYQRKDPARGAFAVWWLLTLSGAFGVFLVADVASFYLAYALVSLSAYGLAAHDDTPEARRAGAVYLALTLFGEALLLAAFVMLASGTTDANPLIRDAVALLPASPWKGAILALLLVGFTLKMGLFPLHVWMPLAHAVAPVPGSAALSGIVVKAGVIGLLRFLPDGVALPAWGTALVAAGLFTAFYGVAIGLTQAHPKRLLAYSTVSQMGVVAVVIGAGLGAGDPAMPMLAAFYAVNHMLLKGGMFLSVGVAMASGPGRLMSVLAVAALMGLSLAGAPFTGGALAKYAAKGPVGEGVAGFLLTLSAAGTALLMARFVLLLSRAAKGAGRAPLGQLAPWAALCLLALVLPYVLYPAATGYAPATAFAPAALVTALWPVALGLACAVVLHKAPPPVPEVPAGDVLVLAERLGPLSGKAMALAMDLDALLRRWPVASLALAALAVLMMAAMGLKGEDLMGAGGTGAGP